MVGSFVILGMTASNYVFLKNFTYSCNPSATPALPRDFIEWLCLFIALR